MARLTQLVVRDFRNIARADLTLPADGIAIVGENGQGKTNLLEAVYYFHVLRSMRGARDQDLVRFDAPAFYVGATVLDAHAREHQLAAAFERAGKRKKIVIDGAETGRLSQALGALPSVVVSPRDVALILGAPSERRRFLDIVLALTSPRYLAALQAYRSVLARRNAVLRDTARNAQRNAQRNAGRTIVHGAGSNRADETVTVWEPALAEHGATLIVERATWIARYSPAFRTLCQAIGEHASVRMRYTTSVPLHVESHEIQWDSVRDTLLDALAHKRSFDMKRGATHVGPHRDDLVLTLGGRDVRVFGSAGQQRTLAIALRMLEASSLREQTGTPPLLLLDDPFAELDPRRAEHILALLHDSGIGQTILTVPRAADIPAEFTKLARWRIDGGVLAPELAPEPSASIPPVSTPIRRVSA
jgi:DNA replication and repair protein RecF